MLRNAKCNVRLGILLNTTLYDWKGTLQPVREEITLGMVTLGMVMES